MAEARVLIVEDDPATQRQVQGHLEAEGFNVRLVSDGQQALDAAFSYSPDLVVLDIDLPFPARGDKLDGLRVLELLREDSAVPIIMLTGTSLASVKVFALEIGADDYLTKPFDARELTARIRAVLRRRDNSPVETILEQGNLRIDPGARRVWRDNREIYLTAIEFELLRTLVRRPGWVFSRTQLIRSVWGHEHFGDERVVDTHIGHLRKKIEADPKRPQFIVTVHGSGYRFEKAAG